MASKDHIQNDLEALSGGDFSEQAKQLLATLGYSSKRTIPYSGDPSEFFTDPSDTISRKNLLKQATSLKLVFQLTDEEISGIGSLFDNNEVDESRAESFYFVTAELQPGTYSRTKYAEMTREINKRYEQSPAVILFRVDKLLTIAFIGRRPHKHDQARDVLGKVTLIKDIRLNNPHRAHLDILSELSLEECAGWIANKNKQKNFDGLLSAWLAKLDTEELNKRFYKQLFNWFERAEKKCTFPGRENKVFLSPQEHIIRLITRLMFIWFIKEKGLIAPALFNEEKIRTLLKDYDPNNGASYYRAVLQNLFFATLNTETDKRRFSKQTNTTHRDFSLYRYKAEMKDPGTLLELFAQTPFINGGLFDCLDSLEGQKKKGYRIDCFSDHPKHSGKLSIPNHLFFGEGGLIPLFEHYKFTVEENTPIEQEVALDPELLGKVFENLLAAHNPETRETVRKQTGSYYTPRAVVDYMVDEALVACLTEKAQPNDDDREYLNARLRYLLDYADAFNDADELFVAAEQDSIVRAIMEMKILDPAVGSGAFPMGTLHKLTLALRRLDPQNQLWEKLQKEKAKQRAGEAFETADQYRRDEELKEISDIFQRYKDSDFGRKLYLIQNNLFGVDIQTVACQIAKLRFFISLAIEQNPNMQAKDHNYGIKPLPNLETRFVAANTLLGLGGRTLASPNAQHLERELYANREQYFHATNRQSKRDCQDRDIELRDELAKELQLTGMPADDADKIAHWDPYDQNASSDWFDAEYMFGINDGFDVVIGNPPYIQLQQDGGRLRKIYQGAGYETLTSTGDIYQLFYEKAAQLLKPKKGLLSYISSNSWLRAQYGKSTRNYFSSHHTPLQLLEMGKDVFENAIVDTCILIARSGTSEETGRAVDMDKLTDKNFPPEAGLWGELHTQGEKPWMALSTVSQSILGKMEAVGTPLQDWNVSINYGIKTGYNQAFIIDDVTRQALIEEDPKSADIIKPVLRGRDIQRFRAQRASLWLIDTHNGYRNVPAINIDDYSAIKNYLDTFYSELEKRNDQGITPYNLRNCAYHQEFAEEKLIWIELVEDGRFAYDDSGIYCEATSFIMVGECLKYLCAMLNSKLIGWFLQHTAPTSGMGTLRWKKVYVEAIPIPKIPVAEQSPFIHLVNDILRAKTDNLEADISGQEVEIDRLVYQLYDLTEEEIEIIENHGTQ